MKYRHGVILLFLMLLAPWCYGAWPNQPRHDFEGVVEHLFEQVEAGRYISLPSPLNELQTGRKETVAQLGFNHLASRVLDMNGVLVSTAHSKALRDGWALQLGVFHSRYQIKGVDAEMWWNPLFSNHLPYDFPQDARFSNGRGTLVHQGISIASFWDLWKERKSKIGFMIIFDKLRTTNFTVDYQITSGSYTGERGQIEHNSDYHYWIPTIIYQKRYQLNASWDGIPRIIFGLPRYKKGFEAKLRFNNQEIAGDTSTAGKGRHMGDFFAGISMIIVRPASGLHADVGVLINQYLISPLADWGIINNLYISAGYCF